MTPIRRRACIFICIAATLSAGFSAPAAAQSIGAPVFNNNQPVLNSGSTVTLVWTPPAIGNPVGYVIEASNAPGGAPQLANFFTGNTSTSLIVPGVPPGVYFVRIRGVDSSGVGPPSNEVQVVVAGASCPTAPLALTIVSQSGGNVSIGWQPPSSGSPASYVLQAGSSPNAADLVNFDTNSTALTFVASNVPAGSYFVRVYARSSGCAPPAFLSPASNEILVRVGTTPPGWTGAIVCQIAITGPSGYRHNETQTWLVGGAGQTVGPRTYYPVQWSAQGSGGGPASNWTINATATTDFSVTIVASTGIPLFDRTTSGIIIRGGIVGTPTSFDLYEIEFPAFSAAASTATTVSGTWSRATSGGDSPQQPSGSTGMLTCTWSFALR